MKVISTLLLLLIALTSPAQVDICALQLTVSPSVKQNDTTNVHIISALRCFLATKNNSVSENSYWSKSDLEQYVYPYLDIYNIEQSRLGNDYFKPTLMELIATDDRNKKIAKIAFIGHNAATGENQLRCIYNIVATLQDGQVLFSSYLPYATRNWETVHAGKITYKLSPLRTVNRKQIKQQVRDEKMLTTFFNVPEIPVTYFSCVGPQELFEIKGFDYNPQMYVSNTGGLAGYGNIIFSGGNTEVYTHEIVHIYTAKLFPGINKLLDEGIATYLAGSSNYSFAWHKEKMRRFFDANPGLKIWDHLDAYEQLYFEQETSVLYLIGALICQRTIRLYGRERLFSLFKSEGTIEELLNSVGLTKDNIDVELRKEVVQ